MVTPAQIPMPIKIGTTFQNKLRPIACCQVFGPGQEEWDAPADEEGDAEAGGDGAPGGLRLGAAQVQGDIPDCPGGLQHCCVPPHHVALLQLLSQVG